ncbi:hypothetical protein AMK59_7695, partial [Oryctes borbonicus]
PPADSIQFNLVNILASYAFTLRYFNGEYLDFIPEAVACIFQAFLSTSTFYTLQYFYRCENALGKYTCPKCNILYCSLTCYQSEIHLQCSEEFYRDSVMANLSPDADSNSKSKMLEILKRIHEENEATHGANEQLDSDDESVDDYLDLADRLAGIDLDDTEKVWEQLTDNEKKEFEAFVCTEDVSKLVKAWSPWWMHHCRSKVLDIEEFEKVKKDCPKIKEDIVNFSDISQTPYNSIWSTSWLHMRLHS